MTTLRIAAVFLGLCLFTMASSASAKDNFWTAPLWGDPEFDENQPMAYVENGAHFVAARQIPPNSGWFITIHLDTDQRNADIKNTLVHKDGSRFTHTAFHTSANVAQDPTDQGGLLTTFAVSDKFMEKAKASNRWVVTVGSIQYSFSLDGSRAALDTVEVLAGELMHVIEQAKSDQQQALNRCASLVAHPYDTASEAEGVAWDDIDAKAAIDACDWALSDDMDNPQLMYFLGRALDKAGKDATAHWLTEAATDGYAMAQYHLGLLYLNGEYVGKDSKVARDWLERGAEQDNLPSKHELAIMMIDSGDTNQWYLGMKMMQRNANTGYPFSQWKFGWYLEVGEAYGSEAPEEAREYYQRAADVGHGDGLYAMARMYRDGIGGDADPKQYLSYLRKAADQGHSKARKELGQD